MSIRYEYDYAWDAGAKTISSLTGNGCFEFSVPKTAIAVFCGLSSEDTGASPNDIKYGFYIDKGRYAIVESGVIRTSLQPFPSDVALFKIERINGTIRYYVDVGIPCADEDETPVYGSIWIENGWRVYPPPSTLLPSIDPIYGTAVNYGIDEEIKLPPEFDEDWILFSDNQTVQIVSDTQSIDGNEQIFYLGFWTGHFSNEYVSVEAEGDNWVHTLKAVKIGEGNPRARLQLIGLAVNTTSSVEVFDIRSSRGGLSAPTLASQLFANPVT